MLRILFATIAMVIGMASAQAQLAHKLGESVHRDIIYFSQEVALNGDITYSANVGPYTASNSGVGIDRLTTKLPGFPVSGIPILSVTNPALRSKILDDAEIWGNPSMSAFATRAGKWLREQGISSAFIHYTQEVSVAPDPQLINDDDAAPVPPGPPKKMMLSLNGTIDRNGRAIYGKPKLLDPDPVFLEVMYVPASAKAGMPSGWNYDNAGVLQYRLLNTRLEPTTGWGYINARGVYDGIVGRDDGLICLMDQRNAGCTSIPDIPDVRRMMDATGAAGAFVDYVRTMEPVYSNGEAVGAISVDARIWSCKEYINKGYFGYFLDMRAERYFAEPASPRVSYVLLSKFQAQGISPVEPYTKSILVEDFKGLLGTRPLIPDNYMLNPHSEGDPIWVVADVIKTPKQAGKGVIYVAPLTASADGGAFDSATTSADVSVTQVPSNSSIKEYIIGNNHTATWNTGTYSRSVFFNLENVDDLEELAIVEEGFDDWMLVAINGYTVFVGPRGGDMLQMGTGTAQSEPSNQCSVSGSGWKCTSIVPVAGVPPNCPAGSFVHTQPGEFGTEYLCAREESRLYDSCSLNYFGGENDTISCRRGCPANMVQYWQNPGMAPPVGEFPGCGNWELSTSWRFNTYIDLRPYLQVGANELYFFVITYGTGEGFVRVRTRSCGVAVGAQEGPPPIPPPDGSAPGVDDFLHGRL